MTTIAEAADLFLDGDANGLDYATSTLRNKRSHFFNYVLPHMGDLPLPELDAHKINLLLDTYPGAESGKRQLMFSVRAFVNWADSRGLDVDPAACTGKLMPPKKSRRKVEPGDIPPTDAVEQLANTIGVMPSRLAPDGRPWRGLAVRLAAYSGLRPAELMAITPAKLDFDGGRILVDQQWSAVDRKLSPPKRGSVRWTVLPPNLEDALADRAAAVGRHDPLFPLESMLDSFSTSGAFNRSYFKPAADATPTWDGDWTMHSLRHHFATWAINVLGLPVVDVSLMMGHATPSITMDMYVGQSPQAFATARAAISKATS